MFIIILYRIPVILDIIVTGTMKAITDIGVNLSMYLAITVLITITITVVVVKVQLNLKTYQD